MFKVILNLLAHKQLKFEEGNIKLLSQNVVIFPFENLFSIQKIIEKEKKTYELYLSAKKLGTTWIKKLFKTYKMNSIEEQAKWGEKIFTLAGMGKMKVVEWDKEKSMMIYRSYDSLTAKSFGRVGRCVCHIPRGWFAGAACVFFEKDVDAVETRCISKGNKFCEFIIKPKKDFDKKNSLVKKQLSK